MRCTNASGFTLEDLVWSILVVFLLGLAAFCLIPWGPSGQATELKDRPVCMSNLSSIGKGIVLYKAANDNKWPWIENVRSDWSNVPTGTNRQLAPNADPNNPGQRSITALMFLRVRDGQPAKLFTCPSDKDAELDANTRLSADANQYNWDFASARNVSYSWQAPVLSGGRYVNGLDDRQVEAVVIGDRTPRSSWPDWRPDDVSKVDARGVIARNMSQNHSGGRKINVLHVGMNVAQYDRPDRGQAQDNIYTASGEADAGSRSAVSLDMADHLSPRDSFLIGPVRKPQGGQAGAGDGPSKAR